MTIQSWRVEVMLPPNQNRKRFGTATDGAVTVEFVLTLPLFLAALAFAFEFGQVFLAHQSTANNVRAASRYLARAGLSDNAEQCARAIVQSGKMNLQDDICAMLPETAYPEYLAPRNADIEIFQDSQRVRIRAAIRYPLTMFWLGGDNRPNIPFVVVEDARYVGS